MLHVERAAVIMSCCAIGCTNRFDENNKKRKFYRIPSPRTPLGANRRRLWLQAIRRNDWNEQIIKNARICSDHFISGEASEDCNSPDFVPSIFSYSRHSGKDGQAKMERYNRKRQREEPSWRCLGNGHQFTPLFPSPNDSEIDRDGDIYTEAMAVHDDLRNKYSRLHAECESLRMDNNRLKAENEHLRAMLIGKIMTQQNQEVKQTDREPEEKLEINALFQTKNIPANVLYGESTEGLHLQDHLHMKKEEEELWENLEVKQETVTVKHEDEEEEAQCSLLHWRQSEENINREPATCSSDKLMKVEPNGDMSEGPEAENTCAQQVRDGEETDCSEDWREPLSQSEAQIEHMDMSCENFHTSENNTDGMSHNREKPHGCDVCGKGFSDRTTLKVHMRIHTGEKPFGCDFCGQKFNQKASLSAHMSNHTGEKPFSCNVCDKEFRRKSDLNRHVRIHTGEKPYGCDVCSHRFNQKASLSAHMRIHTGEKPFSCDVCTKGFNNKTNLNIHTRIHTGERPFVCDVCGKGFHRKSDVNRHALSHGRAVFTNDGPRTGPGPTGDMM